MQVVDESPSRTSQLDAISLVRVFHISDWSPKLGRIKEYAVITAVYSQDGKLLRAGAFGSRGGDWHQDLTGEIQKEHGSLSSLRPEAKKKYGLPDHFPIADYLERRQWEWNEVGKPNPENVINLHYDYNRWVRQDIFDAKGKRTMRYLTYVVTPEDKILEEIDRQVPFGQRKSE